MFALNLIKNSLISTDYFKLSLKNIYLLSLTSVGIGLPQKQSTPICSLCWYNNNIKKRIVPKITSSNKHYSQTQEDVEDKPATKLLKIAIIGTPNSGKSTFINQIVGRRVFAISKKVHTTRRKARAVINLADTQVVFLDTPGLVTQSESTRHQLESAFMKDGESSLTEANVVGVMHDVSNSFTRGQLDPKVLRLLHLYPFKHTVLILNKVDVVKKKRYLLDLASRLTCGTLTEIDIKRQRQHWPKLSEEEVAKEAKREPGWPHFQQVFMVSSLEGSGVGEVMEYLLQFAKPAAWMFPSTVYTDQKPEDVICETVKARMLEHLPNEVPYNCKVQLELYNKLRDGTVMSVVLITSPNLRSEKMLMKRIRQIAQETEAELRNTFLTQVLVKLAVQTVDK